MQEQRQLRCSSCDPDAMKNVFPPEAGSESRDFGGDSHGCVDSARMPWYCSRIWGKKMGAAGRRVDTALLLQNGASAKSLQTLQLLQLKGSQIMHQMPPEKLNPTSNAAHSITPSPIPQWGPLSLSTMLSEQTPLSVCRSMGCFPQASGMPRNTRLPQTTPQRIITLQPRALSFTTQRPHCTVQGVPSEHQP